MNIESRMDRIEASIKALSSIVASVAGIEPPDISGRSELDKKVDEVLKNVHVHEKSLLPIIVNENYCMDMGVIARETLFMSISPLEKGIGLRNTIPATRDHFDIIEGTLEQASLGDVCFHNNGIKEDDTVFVVGFKDGCSVSANYLSHNLIGGVIHDIESPVIILRRRK